MNTASRLISPRTTRSKRSINSLWCAAGSNPQWRHHSVRLLRTRRCFSSISATIAGEMSNAATSGSFDERPCAKLGFVISCCSENVLQLFVSHAVQVVLELLVGSTSGPACPGFGLDVLYGFDKSALSRDAAFRGGCDLAADHGLQSRHSRDLFALADGEQAVGFLPDEPLGTLSFAAPPFSGWIAGLPFAESTVERRFAVPDRGTVLRRRLLFLRAHGCYSAAAVGGADRSRATSSKLVPLTAWVACLPVTRSNRCRMGAQ